jgi:branched-chain amino acid transport system ATP-binding protein
MDNRKDSIILSVEGVSKTFDAKGDHGLRVLDDVDIIIQKGIITAVIGSNGAGKTSLFNIVSGYMDVDKGGDVDFSKKEFESDYSIDSLCEDIEGEIQLDKKLDSSIDALNELLTLPDLYDRVPETRRYETTGASIYLAYLVKESEPFRKLDFKQLNRTQKKLIKILNRKLLQELYSGGCPRHPYGAVVYNKDRPRLLNGTPPDYISKLGIGRLFQDDHLFANLSIWDNMAISAPVSNGEGILDALFKRSKIKREEERLKSCAMDIFKELFPQEDPFTDRMKDYFSKLSFGQQRILSLLRLFMRKYDLLLLDEPTAGVNVEIIEKMAAIIKRMKTEGYSIMLIEHNWEFVLKVADFCYFLDEGKVAAFGTPADVLGNPKVRARYLGR